MNNLFIWLKETFYPNTEDAIQKFCTMQHNVSSSYLEEDCEHAVQQVMKALKKRAQQDNLDRQFKVDTYLKHTERWYVAKLQNLVEDKLNSNEDSVQHQITYHVEIIVSTDNHGYIPDTVKVTINFKDEN